MCCRTSAERGRGYETSRKLQSRICRDRATTDAHRGQIRYLGKSWERAFLRVNHRSKRPDKMGVECRQSRPHSTLGLVHIMGSYMISRRLLLSSASVSLLAYFAGAGSVNRLSAQPQPQFAP